MTATSSRKISELSAATAAAQTDYMVGVEVSTGLTKRFLVSLFRKISVVTGSTTYGPRSAIKFTGGSNVLVNVTDDGPNDQVVVDISDSLGPGSPAHKLFLWQNFT